MEEPGRLQSMGSLRVGHDWVTSLSLSLSCTGEGNGNPLQYSCLENPRDRGDWWAAVHGVAQSRTRLKRLSSSSSAGFLLLPGFSIVGVSRGYSLVTVHRFSIAVASLVAEMGSRCMGFSHYGLWAQLPPQHVESTWTRDWTHECCISRQTQSLDHQGSPWLPF